MSKAEWAIFHNPNCTKSKLTLALLEKRGVTPQVIEYLKTPPTKSEILEIISGLDVPAKSIVRKNDDRYKELQFSLETSESIAENLAKNPSLIERPIVVHNGKAVIGRPPENVEKLFF